MRLAPVTVPIAIALAMALGDRAAAQMTAYEDPHYGFKMRIPKDFHSVPINMAEKWVVAKFLYKRPLEPKNSEWWVERTPELRVIIFPKVDVKQVVAARTAESKKLAIRGKDGKITYVNLLEYLQNPFKGYQEYLRENYKKGGWFVAEEKECKVGGLPAVYKRIEVEDKMATGVKSTLTAWEIDYGDAIYVVQFDVLQDYDHKFTASVRSAVKGFDKCERSEPLRPVLTASRSTETERELVAAAKKKKLTPKERREAREADLKRAIAKAKEGMQAGWSTYTDGPFTVFYSTDRDFARRVSKQAVLMWKWLDKNFDYIGEDHSVGNILRVCKSAAEAQSYGETSTRSDLSMTAREIVLWDDKDWGWTEMGSGKLNWRVAQQFLLDKNPRLWIGLPPWLDDGLGLYVMSLRMKGRKLVAKPDEWDMEAIRNRLREDKFRPSREMLQLTWDEYNRSRSDSADRVQSLAIVNFLFETRNKHYRNALHDYIRELDVRLREFEDKRAKDLSNSKKDLGQWTKEWTAAREKVYKDCYAKVFGGWSDKAWLVFDHAWREMY